MTKIKHTGEDFIAQVVEAAEDFCMLAETDKTDKTDSWVGAIGDPHKVSGTQLPEIFLEAGALDRICDAAEQALSQQINLYQRGNLICFSLHNLETNDISIKPLTRPGLLRVLSRSATWYRWDEQKGLEKLCDPPDRIVSSVFDSQHYPHLKPLAGIARQPFLRPDDSIVTLNGYDEDTKVLANFDPTQFPIQSVVSISDAKAALAALTLLLSEFSFANECDKSAALGAILTAAIRPSLPVAPMFHVKAHQVSSGKSYLCSLIAAFSSGRIPPAAAFPTKEEEAQKFLLATFLEAPSCLIFDNLTTDIYPYPSLCSALTEPFLSGRILGISKTATVSTSTLILSSGNNVSPIKDMTRRCLTIHLDPKMEIPAEKKYSGDPIKIIRARRGEYVAQALNIIQGWIQAGRPKTNCKSLASYDRWTDLVRQPLLWLGQPDPATRLFSQLAEDPDREYLGRLLGLWSEIFGTTPKMVREVVQYANDFLPGSRDSARDELKEALREQFEERGDINRKRLGKWLSRIEGQVVGGLRFEKLPGTFSAEKWVLRKNPQG
jgi:hypothetical protein